MSAATANPAENAPAPVAETSTVAAPPMPNQPGPSMGGGGEPVAEAVAIRVTVIVYLTAWLGGGLVALAAAPRVDWSVPQVAASSIPGVDMPEGRSGHVAFTLR